MIFYVKRLEPLVFWIKQLLKQKFVLANFTCDFAIPLKICAESGISQAFCGLACAFVDGKKISSPAWMAMDEDKNGERDDD